MNNNNYIEDINKLKSLFLSRVDDFARALVYDSPHLVYSWRNINDYNKKEIEFFRHNVSGLIYDVCISWPGWTDYYGAYPHDEFWEMYNIICDSVFKAVDNYVKKFANDETYNPDEHFEWERNYFDIIYHK